MPTLPTSYIYNMSRLLGDESEAFFKSYEEPRAFGLRLNPLKVRAADPAARRMTEMFGLHPVPWCADGYFYEESSRPGRHPYHAAGLYYMQEPSAMIAAELLNPQPGEIVLDLAAAPGGKTTQIAGRMKGRGLLIANEIHPSRAKILSENVERLGISNTMVTQASPQELSARFPERFDRILLDAPCSGEGMFRKDPDAVREWSPESVNACAVRQRDILPHAARMLKPGGTLVYSTCTFNTVENEETIADFLSRHPEFRLVREERMWPHLGQGEGHYAALLQREASAGSADRSAKAASKSRKGSSAPKLEEAAVQTFRKFAEESLPGFRLPEPGSPLLFGEALYWLPAPAGSPAAPETLRGLKIPRPGLHLGDIRKGRFEPAHALAMAVAAHDAAVTADYPADSAEIAAYLRGETLPAAPGTKGWGLTTVDGYPLGWFKASDGQQKNRLPKGLRLLSK
ncbi:NOL1/NOP2/sun family putative RNA methylase [Cohnella pontilimi]|uniref:NOL1/NOP2/sun family putative RNA methylase n=1 Tax=Cohnella pontilimi TaxID=2564100 RepID=A0A4U0FA21_9BACL|nr:RsmB/NOP family class I SAM-dependent RNA methyltransferase [Cohnella pontilimi]TJY41368.1 NOL1/NOP2/sun family putative RNA methylase [Cohnella pontilimi]